MCSEQGALGCVGVSGQGFKSGYPQDIVKHFTYSLLRNNPKREYCCHPTRDKETEDRLEHPRASGTSPLSLTYRYGP